KRLERITVTPRPTGTDCRCRVGRSAAVCWYQHGALLRSDHYGTDRVERFELDHLLGDHRCGQPRDDHRLVAADRPCWTTPTTHGVLDRYGHSGRRAGLRVSYRTQPDHDADLHAGLRLILRHRHGAGLLGHPRRGLPPGPPSRRARCRLYSELVVELRSIDGVFASGGSPRLRHSLLDLRGHLFSRTGVRVPSRPRDQEPQLRRGRTRSTGPRVRQELTRTAARCLFTKNNAPGFETRGIELSSLTPRRG